MTPAGGRVWPGLAAHAAERWAAFPSLVVEWGLRTGNDGKTFHGSGSCPGQEHSKRGC